MMADKAKTFVWEYFVKESNNEEAKCRKCHAIIKCVKVFQQVV